MTKGRRVRVRDRRRWLGDRRVLLAVSGAGAAMVLMLGVSGTLSTWTQAIISNDTNTVATAKAVVLQETGPASQGTPVCRSSDGAQVVVNSFSCTTINKYGGTTTPLTPGSSVTTDVVFKNIGSANGTSFALAPGVCSQSPTAGSGTPAAGNLCTSGDLTVSAKCSPGATFVAGSAWSDLSYAAAAPPTATKTHTATAGDLNVGSTWTCEVVVALSASAPLADQGITLSQALTWTLNG